MELEATNGKRRSVISILLLAMLLLPGQTGLAQSRAENKSNSQQPAAADQAPLVRGVGTIGQLTKWIGGDAKNSFIGDSIITEIAGQIGIGTSTPTSPLTVHGMIETTL